MSIKSLNAKLRLILNACRNTARISKSCKVVHSSDLLQKDTLWLPFLDSTDALEVAWLTNVAQVVIFSIIVVLNNCAILIKKGICEIFWHLVIWELSFIVWIKVEISYDWLRGTLNVLYLSIVSLAVSD